MIISHQRQFIFIHTYKVAGTSVKAALKPYADIYYRKYSLQRLFYVLGLAPPPGDHLSASEIRLQLGETIFDRYFSFAFVRNPWDWQVSLYHYISSHPLHPQHSLFKSFGNFSDYLKWRIAEGVELQKDFITDDNNEIIVNYVGRYETLANDFNYACSRIGIQTELPHKNISRHNNYRKYYNDETAELIAKHYQQDIEMFNYHF